jgi:hypothetical protein
MLGSLAQAQVGGAEPKADERVKALLDELGLKYEIDEDKDFKLVFEVGDKGRSQVVWIRSKTETYRNLEIREIMSPGFVAEKEEIPHYVAIKMLEDNRSKKMGAWQKDGKYGVFVAHIAAQLDSDALNSALIFTVEAADEMEEQLTGEEDDF